MVITAITNGHGNSISNVSLWQIAMTHHWYRTRCCAPEPFPDFADHLLLHRLPKSSRASKSSPWSSKKTQASDWLLSSTVYSCSEIWLLYFSRDLPNATIWTSFAAHLQNAATRTILDGMPWNFVYSILHILYWCSNHCELKFYLSDFPVFYALTTRFHCDRMLPVQAITRLVPWKKIT